MFREKTIALKLNVIEHLGDKDFTIFKALRPNPHSLSCGTNGLSGLFRHKTCCLMPLPWRKAFCLSVDKTYNH